MSAGFERLVRRNAAIECGLRAERSDEVQCAESARPAGVDGGPARRGGTPAPRVRGSIVRAGAAVSPLDDAVDAAWADAWFRAQPERAVRRLDSALTATPLRTLAVDAGETPDCRRVASPADRTRRARSSRNSMPTSEIRCCVVSLRTGASRRARRDCHR
jgi:hypothetical protein